MARNPPERGRSSRFGKRPVCILGANQAMGWSPRCCPGGWALLGVGTGAGEWGGPSVWGACASEMAGSWLLSRG